MRARWRQDDGTGLPERSVKSVFVHMNSFTMLGPGFRAIDMCTRALRSCDLNIFGSSSPSTGAEAPLLSISSLSPQLGVAACERLFGPS